MMNSMRLLRGLKAIQTYAEQTRHLVTAEWAIEAIRFVGEKMDKDYLPEFEASIRADEQAVAAKAKQEWDKLEAALRAELAKFDGKVILSENDVNRLATFNIKPTPVTVTIKPL